MDPRREIWGESDTLWLALSRVFILLGVAGPLLWLLFSIIQAVNNP